MVMFKFFSTLLLLLLPLARTDVVRRGNLDYLDAATVRYFLNSTTRADYDVVVLFYAQWCQNCHAFAGIYDKIAKLLKAGESDVIAGLFDCESNYEAATVCSAAGVTHYPTIAYINTAGIKLQHKKPKHLTKFSGNWQYGDAVLDWIKTLRALSKWHRSSWREKLFGGGTRKGEPEKKQLPIGVPVSDTAKLQQQLKTLQEEAKKSNELALRSSWFVDTLLFPVKANGAETALMTDGYKNFTDLFAYLQQEKAWNSTDPAHVLLRTCGVEVALDYCQRVGTLATEEWLLPFDGALEKIPESAWSTFEADVIGLIKKFEPYCAVLEECVKKDYKDDHCRPDKCPFSDVVACRYVSTCFQPDIQEEYATALGMTLTEATETPEQITTKQETKPKKSAWGVA